MFQAPGSNVHSWAQQQSDGCLDIYTAHENGMGNSASEKTKDRTDCHFWRWFLVSSPTEAALPC
jgi:hypothetical protein